MTISIDTFREFRYNKYIVKNSMNITTEPPTSVSDIQERWPNLGSTEFTAHARYNGTTNPVHFLNPLFKSDSPIVYVAGREDFYKDLVVPTDILVNTNSQETLRVVDIFEHPEQNRRNDAELLLELGYKRYGNHAIDIKLESLHESPDSITLVVYNSQNIPMATLSAELISYKERIRQPLRVTGLDLVNAGKVISEKFPGKEINHIVEFNGLVMANEKGEIGLPEDLQVAKYAIFAMCHMVDTWLRYKIDPDDLSTTVMFAIMQSPIGALFTDKFNVPLEILAKNSAVQFNERFAGYINDTITYWAGSKGTDINSTPVVSILARPFEEFEIEIEKFLRLPIKQSES